MHHMGVIDLVNAYVFSGLYGVSAVLWLTSP